MLTVFLFFFVAHLRHDRLVRGIDRVPVDWGTDCRPLHVTLSSRDLLFRRWRSLLKCCELIKGIKPVSFKTSLFKFEFSIEIHLNALQATSNDSYLMQLL